MSVPPPLPRAPIRPSNPPPPPNLFRDARAPLSPTPLPFPSFDLTHRDERGNTLLHIAAKHGHRQLLNVILNQGADINAKNNMGNTALHFVCDPVLQLHVDPEKRLATLLLSRGADPAPMNNELLLPHQGLSESKSSADEEREFMGHSLMTRPVETVHHGQQHRSFVAGTWRQQMIRAAPHPSAEKFRPKPPALAPWETEDALPPRPEKTPLKKTGGAGNPALLAASAARAAAKVSSPG